MSYFTKGTFAKHFVLGNIGRKELISVPYNEGKLPVLKLQVGVNFRNGKDTTIWIPVSIAGIRAEKLNEILSVGDKVLAEGPITASTWQAQDGTNRKRFNFQANSVVIIRSKGKKATEEPEEEPEEEEVAPQEEDEEIPF